MAQDATALLHSLNCYHTIQMKMLNIEGEKHNRLTVINFSHSNGKYRYWKCLCDCGNFTTLPATTITKGYTKSCGCLHRETAGKLGKTANKSHGMTGSRTYSSWSGMMTRCYNTNNEEYQNYGAKGITVIKRWHKFANFYADMGDRPYGKTLDRINGKLGYKKSNCRWATRTQQSQNRTIVVFIEFGGERLCLTDWSRRTGINTTTLSYRLQNGWPVDKVLTAPPYSYKHTK